MNVNTVTKEQLETWYVTEKKSTRDIAVLLGCSQPWARKSLIEHGIEMRTYKDNKTPVAKGSHLTEAHKKAIRKSLIGNSNCINAETGKHHNDQRIMVICANCDAEVWKKPSYYNKTDVHYCSNQCANEGKEGTDKGGKVKVQCEECGAELIRKRWEIEKKKQGFFCSHACKGTWLSKHKTGDKIYNFKGGYKGYYGTSWPAARRAARRRDNWTCQRCLRTKQEMKKNPDVHHIIPFRMFGLARHKEANDLSNLISYCNRCHKIVESEAEGNAMP